jgi:hypothetical protein
VEPLRVGRHDRAEPGDVVDLAADDLDEAGVVRAAVEEQRDIVAVVELVGPSMYLPTLRPQLLPVHSHDGSSYRSELRRTWPNFAIPRRVGVRTGKIWS